MSIEYYTPIPYEEGKAKLLAAAGEDYVYEDAPDKYLPECQAFKFKHVPTGQYLWFLRETRTRPESAKFQPVGSLVMECFGANKVRHFMPWVERTLGCRVLSEVGLEWELDQ